MYYQNIINHNLKYYFLKSFKPKLEFGGLKAQEKLLSLEEKVYEALDSRKDV